MLNQNNGYQPFSFGAHNPAPAYMPPNNQGGFTLPQYGSNNVNAMNQPANTMVNNNAPGAAAGTGADWSMMDRLVGGTDKDGNSIGGAAMPAIQMGTGLLQGYLGMKQLGLAQDQFSESKKQFGLNYDAQRTTTNSQLEDRQRARVASNPNAYESVDSYMNSNQIKAR